MVARTSSLRAPPPPLPPPLPGRLCAPASLVHVEATRADAGLALLFQNAAEAALEDAAGGACRLAGGAAGTRASWALEPGWQDAVGPTDGRERRECGELGRGSVGPLDAGSIRRVSAAVGAGDADIPQPQQQQQQQRRSLREATAREQRVPAELLPAGDGLQAIVRPASPDAVLAGGPESSVQVDSAEAANALSERASSLSETDGTDYADSLLGTDEEADTDISEPDYAFLSVPPFHYSSTARALRENLTGTSFLWLDGEDGDECPGGSEHRRPLLASAAIADAIVVRETELSETSWYSPLLGTADEPDGGGWSEPEPVFEYATATRSPVSPARARVVEIPRRASNASSMSSLALDGDPACPQPCVTVTAPTPKLAASRDIDAWMRACQGAV